jgi:hypothetical protein
MPFVNQAGVEETPECFGASLNEDVSHAPAAQFSEKRRDRWPAVSGWQWEHFIRQFAVRARSRDDQRRFIEGAQQLANLR